MAPILRPLYQAMSGKPKPKILKWTLDMISAFQTSKQAVADATMLMHPSTTSPIFLVTDASDTGIGVTLQQRRNGIDSPLEFYSRQLRKPELSYSAYDKELLAIYLSIRHFRFFLEGRSFTVYTDHKPLTSAMAKISDQWSARQQRQLSYISEYTTDIRHVSGQENNVADALSRSPISALHEGINFQEMASDQENDPESQASWTANTNLQLRDLPLSCTNLTFFCDISTNRERPLVPLNWSF